MNLFKKHGGKKENDAKALLTAYVYGNLVGYIKTQKALNELLVEATNKNFGRKPPKKLIKAIDKFINVMTTFELRIAEGNKSYELLFDEKLDMDPLVQRAGDKNYPMSKGECPCPKCVAKRTRQALEKADGKSSGDVNVSLEGDNADPEVSEMMRRVGKALKGFTTKDGKKAKIKIMDINNPEDTLGLDPKDFPSFGDFIKAVEARRVSLEKGETPEEVLNNTIIQNAEEKAKENGLPKKPERLN